jgi:hypothetical protein
MVPLSCRSGRAVPLKNRSGKRHYRTKFLLSCAVFLVCHVESLSNSISAPLEAFSALLFNFEKLFFIKGLHKGPLKGD